MPLPSEKVQDVVSSMAEAINGAKVPCVLWDEVMIDLFGGALGPINKSRFLHYDFVVPDHLLEVAKQALLGCKGSVTDKESRIQFSLEECTSDNCSSCVSRTMLLPDVHLHLTKIDDRSMCRGDRTNPDVWLFRQSSVLWHLPPLDERYLVPPNATHDSRFLQLIEPHYVLSTDKKVCPPLRKSRREEFPLDEGYYYQPQLNGFGVWDESLFPVLAPKPPLAVEALARVIVRHYCTGRTGNLSIHMWSMRKEGLNGGSYSLERLQPALFEFVYSYLSPKKPSEIARELSVLWRERGAYERITHEAMVAKMLRHGPDHPRRAR